MWVSVHLYVSVCLSERAISSTHVGRSNLHLWGGGGASHRPSALMRYSGEEGDCDDDEPHSLGCWSHARIIMLMRLCWAPTEINQFHQSRTLFKNRKCRLQLAESSTNRLWTVQPRQVVSMWVVWVLNIHLGWHPLRAKMGYGSWLHLLWVRPASSHRK